MRCKDCGYYYQDTHDRYPCCHFDARIPEWAPCAQEEPDYEDNDE